MRLDDAPHRRRPSTLRFVLWTVAALIIGAGASLLFWPRAIEPPAAPQAAGGDAAQGATHQVTLYFGDPAGRALVTERRDVSSTTSLEAGVEVVVQALQDGPEISGAVRTIPVGARLRRVFVDSEAATAYLDFDPALVTQHPGGTTAEHATVGALVRTLGANFPEIVRIQILVDGQAVETLAGHFDISAPIEIASWE